MRRLSPPAPRTKTAPSPAPLRGMHNAGALCLGVALVLGSGSDAAAQRVDPSDFEGLSYRAVGPAAIGGRMADVAGVPGDPDILYLASASGGLFKSTDGGTTFASIFEGQPVLSIGAIALEPGDPEVIWVGTGEGNPRNTASFGNGVYLSEDGGGSWTHLGLDDTEKIARIRVHPTDPDVVYVAALGHEWGPNEKRGVYRTTDRGRTWERVLYVNPTTGASDVVLDPEDPDIVYAGMYDFIRRPWRLRSGGPGSGLWRSADGGDTWEELTAGAPGNGLPEGTIGRVGVDVSHADPNVVYAMMESEAEGELWRSDDGGRTWRMVAADPDLVSRGFYYADVRAGRDDPDRVYAVSGDLLLSEDGGVTWREIGQGTHGDYQALWIDPTDTERLLMGSDGGGYVSHDRGEQWEMFDQIVLAQAYHVNVDMREPWHMCGGLQDNGTWCGPNERWNVAGTRNRDWARIQFGDGFYGVPDPTDWRTVYSNAHFGNIIRVDMVTGEQVWIQPYPVDLTGSAAGDHPYRFNWNSPIHMSPHDPDVVYFGSNVLFRTDDGGMTWDTLSPDLTTDDPEKQRPSGGPIALDNTSAEYHTTIVAISESPVEPGVIWVGTDDGNVQLSRDGGASWTNVVDRIAGVPPHSWVPSVDASDHERGVAWVVFDRHRDDDLTPRVFRTDDYGESWTNVTGNLPELGWPHVVKDDPRNPDLVYVGTETGVYASWSRGGDWADIRMGLPRVAVRDLVVHPRDNDLVLATHGLGFQVLDDAAPLQEMPEALAADVHLFTPPDAVRYDPWNDYRYSGGQQVFMGENAPYGALLTFRLSEAAAASGVEVVIENASGDAVRALEPEVVPGLNRITWDLREAPPLGVDAVEGPQVLPGSYGVQVRAGGSESSGSVTVRIDPRREIAPGALEAQHALATRLATAAARLERAVERIDGALARDGGDDAGDAEAGAAGGADLTAEQRAALEALRDRLVADPGGYRSPARLRGKIERLFGAVDQAKVRPPDAQLEWAGRFEAELDEVVAELERVLGPSTRDTLAWETRTVERTSERCPDTVDDPRPCADVLLSWPHFEAAATPEGRAPIRAWVDTALLSPLWEDGSIAPSPGAWADAFLADFEALLEDGPTTAPGWAVERVVEVVYQDPTVLSLRMDEYAYTGGAHPNGARILATLDPATGRRLALEDLFLPGWRRPLLELAERGFREARGLEPGIELEEEGFWFEGGFTLADEWAVVGDGLVFRWNPYDVGPYALGPTEIVLPREALADLVAPGSPLAR